MITGDPRLIVQAKELGGFPRLRFGMNDVNTLWREDAVEAFRAPYRKHFREFLPPSRNAFTRGRGTLSFGTIRVMIHSKLPYSTVTDFARLRGLSTSVPRATAV